MPESYLTIKGSDNSLRSDYRVLTRPLPFRIDNDFSGQHNWRRWASAFYSPFYTLFYYFFLYMMLYERYVTIGSPGLGTVKINIIYLLGYQDIAGLAGFLLLFTWFCHEYKEYFITKEVMIGSVVVVFSLIVAFIIGETHGSFFSNDLRKFIWFFGGISFGIILVKTNRFLLHFTVFVCLITCFMYLSAVESFYIVHASFPDRLYGFNIYYFAGLLIVPLCLLTTLLPRKRWAYLVLPLVLLAVYFYVLGYLSATRSSFIWGIAILALCGISLMYQNTENYISVKVNKRQRRFLLLLFFVIMFVLVAKYESIESSSVIIERFNEGAALMTVSRLDEMLSLFRNTNAFEFFFGRGLGGYYVSDGCRTPNLHLGIFYYFLKFGILPFVIVGYFFYVKFPLFFYNAVCHPAKMEIMERTAVLVVLPGILVLALVHISSGGTVESTAFGMGLSYFLYQHIRRFGIKVLLS